MAVSEKDIKMLWGRAAARCSHLGCATSCIDVLTCETFLTGEMAHIIARQETGPRGIVGGGGDKYDNLILLCPTHHRMIDKAPPGSYPKEELIRWKDGHEQDVAKALESPPFRTIGEVCQYIEKLLIENRTVWQTYGPESAEAISNPYSNLANLWPLRKLDTIVPNNTRITNSIQRNKFLFDNASYRSACLFVEHAKGFERNCYERFEGIPRFPQQFLEMVTVHAAA